MYTIGNLLTYGIIIIAVLFIVPIIATIAIGVITSVFAVGAIYINALIKLVKNLFNGYKCKKTTIVAAKSCI